MKFLIYILLVVLTGFPIPDVWSQRLVEQDITGELIPDQLSKKSIFHLDITTGEEEEFILRASSLKPFSVFSGENLIQSGVTSFQWNIDSLKEVQNLVNRLTFFTQSESPIKVTKIIVVKSEEFTSGLRKKNNLMNFGIVGGITLLIFFSILVQNFSRNTSEYLVLLKIFSLKRREDSINEARIQTATTILFFAFVLVMVSILYTLYFSEGEYGSSYYFLFWLKHLGIICLITCFYLLLVTSIAWIFNLLEVLDHQVLGIFRLAFFLSLMVGFLLLIGFIFGLPEPQIRTFINFLVPVLIFIYYFTFFTRIRKSSGLKPLHLFSYLCISEIIPLVILIFTI